MTQHAITFHHPPDRTTADERIQALSWHSWGRNNLSGSDELYWNMVWTQRNSIRQSFTDESLPLLLLNEPEYAWQANMSPEQVASAWTLYSDYLGPVYIGGYGVEYLWQFKQALQFYDGPRYWAGVHMHVYGWPWNWREVLPQQLIAWKEQCVGEELIVSEWGFFPVIGWEQYCADNLESLWKLIDKVLSPTKAFWFVYNIDGSQDVGGIAWSNTSVVNGVIGKAWLRLLDSVGGAGYSHHTWLPYIGNS